jgi:arylsulfatase A-like enzyme
MINTTIAIAAAALTAPSTEAKPKPNIIYILADDLGYGELGSYGQTKIKTPNLDRLAEQGVRLTNHYSGAPVCGPARCTLITGRHLGHSIVRDNWEDGGYEQSETAKEGQYPLPPNTYTIGTMLQKAGYQTGSVGKWGLGGPESTGLPQDQGFDFFFGYLCQRKAHNYYPTHLWRNDEKINLRNRYFDAHQTLKEDPNDPANYEQYSGKVYAADVMADQGVQFVRKNAKTPFFLYAAYAVPHVALQVPQDSVDEYIGKFPGEKPYPGGRGYLPHYKPLSAYAAMITRMDRDIGDLMDTLDELGIADNTLIMFTSDNGPTHDVGGVDTGFFNSADGLRGLKGSVFEGGLRVPFIARWPGKIEAGTESAFPSAFWDMMPTFAEVAGTSVDAETDGVSMLPALFGETEKRDGHLLWEFSGYGGQQAVRKGKWKAVRQQVKKNPDAPIMLFDLSVDRNEKNDVAAQNPEIVERLKKIMFSDRSPAVLDSWENWVQKGKLE